MDLINIFLKNNIYIIFFFFPFFNSIFVAANSQNTQVLLAATYVAANSLVLGATHVAANNTRVC